MGQLTDDVVNSIVPEPQLDPIDTGGAPSKPGRELWYPDLSDRMDRIQTRFGMGELDVNEGVQGFKALTGQVTYEAVDSELKALRSSKDAELNRRTLVPFADAEATFFTNGLDYAQKTLEDTAQSLPFMGAVIQEALPYAATGAAVGAGAGLAGGVVIPTVGEEPLTVGSGAALGARWGFNAGQFFGSARIMSGQAYMKYRRAGVPDDNARTLALTEGIINGVVEAAGLDRMGVIAKRSFARSLKTPEGRKAMGHLIGGYLKEVGLQTGEEGVQETVSIMTEQLAAAIEENPDIGVYGTEITDRLAETIASSIGPSAVMVGGTSAISSGAGSITKGSIELAGLVSKAGVEEGRTVAAEKDVKLAVGSQLAQRVMVGKINFQTAMEALKSVWTDKPPTPEQIAQVANQDPTETLDSLLAPLTKETIRQEQTRATIMARVVMDATAEGTQLPRVSPAEAWRIAGDVEIQDVPDMRTTTISSPEVALRRAAVVKELRSLDKEIDALENEYIETVVRNETRIQEDLTKVAVETEAVTANIAALEEELQARRTKDPEAKTKTLEGKIQAKKTKLQALEDQKLLLDTELESTMYSSPTARVEASLEKLYQKRGVLQTEADLIVSGLATPEDIAKGKVTTSVGRLSRIRVAAIQKQYVAFKEGLRVGKRTALANAKAIQRALTSFVRSAPILKSDRLKFIDAIRNIQTAEQMANRFPDLIDRAIRLNEHALRRLARARVAKVLKDTQVKRQGRIVKMKMGLDNHALLKAIHTMMKDRSLREETNTLYSAVIETGQGVINGQIVTLGDLAAEGKLTNAMAAAITSGFESFDAEQMTALADVMEGIATDGKLKRLERMADRQERKRIVAEFGARSIIGEGRPDVSSVDKTGDTLAKKFEAFMAGQSSWRTLLSVMSEYDPTHELVDLLDVHTAKRVEMAETSRMVEVFRNTVAEFISAVGDEKDRAKAVFKQLDRLHQRVSIQYFHKSGAVKEDTFTRAQLIQIWMKMYDKNGLVSKNLNDLRTLHFGNEYTLSELLLPQIERFINDADIRLQDPELSDGERKRLEESRDILEAEADEYRRAISPLAPSTAAAIDAALSDADKKLGMAILSFYEAYGNRVNAWLEGNMGWSLARVENYSPSYRSEVDRSIYDGPLQAAIELASLLPGATIARVDSIKPFEFKNPVNDVLRHIAGFEHAFAYHEILDDINAVFSDGKTRTLLKEQYGSGFVSIVDNYIQAFIQNRHRVYDAATNMFDDIRSKFVVAKLGAKTVYQAAIQLSSMFTYLDYLPPNKTTAMSIVSAYKELSNPKRANEIIDTLWSSPIINARWFNLSRDLAEAMNNDAYSWLGKTSKIHDLMLIGLRVGDKTNILLGGYPLYKAWLDATGSHDIAIQKLERAIEETQQSGSIDQLSAWQRGNAYQRMFSTMFVSQQNQLLQKSTLAFRDFIRTGANKQSFGVLANKMLIYWVLPAATVEIIASGFDYDEPEDYAELLRAAIMGPITGVFGLGETIDIGSRYLLYTLLKASGAEAEAPYLPSDALVKELVSDPVAAFTAIAKAWDSGGSTDVFGVEVAGAAEDEKITDAIYKTARVLDISGLPTENLSRIVEGFQEAIQAGDPLGAAMAVSGWPLSVIKKRARKKEKQDSYDPFAGASPQERDIITEITNMFFDFNESQDRAANGDDGDIDIDLDDLDARAATWDQFVDNEEDGADTGSESLTPVGGQ